MPASSAASGRPESSATPRLRKAISAVTDKWEQFPTKVLNDLTLPAPEDTTLDEDQSVDLSCSHSARIHTSPPIHHGAFRPLGRNPFNPPFFF